MVLQNTGRLNVYNGGRGRRDEGGGGGGEGQKTGAPGGAQENNERRDDTSEFRFAQSLANDRVDSKYGFERVKDTHERTGWLLNMHPNEVLDDDKKLVSAVDYYFLQEDGARFKATLAFKPYFYILPKSGTEKEVALFLQKKYSGYIVTAEYGAKEDLDLPNHLVGLKQKYLKLSFMNVTDLMRVRKDILPAVKKNKEREKSHTAYADLMQESFIGDMAGEGDQKKTGTDQLENIIDIREYDVPYHVRVSIDQRIFVGLWYSVKLQAGEIHAPIIQRRMDLIEHPDTIVLAFDIETTKAPLKFPDASIDQIMMISYMIDAQGYLITNREIVSSDVDDFEYTPKPEFEGNFVIFNEANELALIQRFFDHILEIKPHIFATYNGDFFDWKFIEARATIHNMDMRTEIGFAADKQGIYSCRPCIHMDCLCWVRRDSYLPVGSQNLKAVAKAKLRYDPVELDPEDMCRMAAEQPQILSNYSVSDAVATYYLYMKYVHPFIFALCTIIPMEADEVLRKGSGTLCEALLMVEAFHGNIIFPNKQESALNKMTEDGHVLDQETYVGGHVEALESGVFRADIPCRFKLVPEIFDTLIEGVEKTMKHTLEEEEQVPVSQVTNFEQVVNAVKKDLKAMRDNPIRNEYPLIYHLDVGAMYPNIILTNRLQPSAMVNEADCASCDFNKPGAACQREMEWTWRGEYMPASRSEFQRIQQQLEIEKFPPEFPGGPPRPFHVLTKEERASFEKKRLTDYCRKAYKKTKVTKTEVRTQTVCQRENAFYVDTVRAFRDRRYEYKALNKTAKKQVVDAVASGDATEIKSAKNREVLYDSLQLAHKCILNSFYGYVMRKGARWHSMEMAGIVCHTGGNIIRRAREIIEKVGRPLELDTDGIWCILPSSFPENFTFTTSLEKKGKVTVSYPNAVLNMMVKDTFTNDQYHELTNPDTCGYTVRSENSIFFEVDGPYLAMILPASKEEGKKLKKRYAVFNKDRSLAELKGFEIKRRGELQLLKNFQSSVFDAFLGGDTLEGCYSSVAKVADYWLDVLYSKAADMPDSELFELISENRSMSRKLEDYGSQKSTSISTAKRLAEFLGDQMVKDAGLSCRFIIAKKPEGSTVTERAIPLAIFQSEPSVKKHFLRRWLKDSSLNNFDIRALLDWDYYIERLGSSIQKIVTIPAALQGIPNPVPRIAHPEWLHKRLLEKTDILKQRRINEIFSAMPRVREPVPVDIEEIGGGTRPARSMVVVSTQRRRDKPDSPASGPNLSKHWKEALGPAPPQGEDAESIAKWLLFHKKKWAFQAKQRAERGTKANLVQDGRDFGLASVRKHQGPATLGSFLRQAQLTLLNSPWQVIQLVETAHPGLFRAWVLVGQELHQVKLNVPRIFYLNTKDTKDVEQDHVRKCGRSLPRCHQVYNLYEYTIPEELYKTTSNDLLTDLITPSVEGIYETQVPLEFRALITMGSICSVDRQTARKIRDTTGDTFDLKSLNFVPLTPDFPYLDLKTVKYIYMYHHKSGSKSMIGIIIPPLNKGSVFVIDTVRSNQMPGLNSLYNNSRNDRISKGEEEDTLPGPNYTFEVKFETDMGIVYRGIHRILQSYKDAKLGATVIALQSKREFSHWAAAVPLLGEFPVIPIHVTDVDNLYAALDWQNKGAKILMRHFLRSKTVLSASIQLSRYFQVPVGNIPSDSTLFGCDIFYARHLLRQNFALWCSQTERPDLGGKEADDNRLITEFDEQSSIVLNQPAFYQTVCVELDMDGLAVNTLLQAHHVHDIEGTASTVAFDAMPQQSLEEMMGNQPGPSLASYDETALCSNAFRVLRTMVGAWLRDVSVNRNVIADYQLINFYRWLRSPHALLYDPALRKTLNSLMKKLFIQLIAELMRLGATIIHADFSKLIICTKKSRVADALCYVEYITQSIKNKELFHSIDIKVIQAWECLMWLDSANYGGVKGKIKEPKKKTTQNQQKNSKRRKIFPSSDGGNEEQEKSDEEEEEEEDEELSLSEDEEEPEMDMHWSLINYLPDVANCKANFMTTVSSYIKAIYQNLVNELDGFIPGQTPVRKRLSATQPTPRRKGNNPLLQGTVEFSKALVQGELAQVLFGVVQQIDRKYPHPVDPADNSPATFASSAPAEKPALEFIKAIHKVLSLDANIEDDAFKLRRNLLKLIGVPEFSNSAQWFEPCVSVLLPEVICRVCNQCRDIDLCKDFNIGIENDLPVWFCPACKANYDTAEIEQSLVEVINRKLMAFVLQDLQCTKCKQIKEDNMLSNCTCAGVLKTLVDVKTFTTKLKAFRGIALQFGMPLLLQNVDWILKMNPTLQT